MRDRCSIYAWLTVFIVGAVCSAAQSPAGESTPAERLVGTWTGTWDGAGSGGFELTVEKDKSGAVIGRVSVTGEPTYKATLKELTFDGEKLDGKYDFTPDERAEVILSATVEGNNATGTWMLREKANGSEVASGGWKVSKKS